MKNFGFSAALAAVLALAGADAASAADVDLLTKAPIYVAPAATGPATCGSAYDFAVTDCVLSWWGVTFYGTIDVGVTSQTHGTPFDPNHPVGASYLLGNSATNAVGRTAGVGLGPNALSQSNVGFKWKEPVGAGWSFVGQGELAFDPYSGLLANAPRAMFNAIGVPENQQLIPYDSSRWGWLAAQNFLGFSSPLYGTLTFGRQNTPFLDAINAYDPMGGSYAFSLIGNSGKTCGAGDTETCRWTTAIKYRVVSDNFRLSAMVQPFGLWSNSGGFGTYNPNNGAVEVGVGGDIRHLGPGNLSVDVVGGWEKDAVNWSTLFVGPGGAAVTTTTGWPTPAAFVGGTAFSGLKATISDNTSILVTAKYSFGSWGDPAPPIVGKFAPPPSGPVGIPLTLFAGYEWIQFASPSDPQTVFHDDGFLFTATNAAGSVLNPLNGTTIANNAFNANCGQAGGGCTDEIFQIMWTGAKYGLTRDLDLTGAYYHYIQNAYVVDVVARCPAPGGVSAGNSRCAGWFDVYSMVLDWRFLPKWDAYIGTMYSAAYGAIANGDISRNNLATTAGVRFRF
jgi:predicted porin